MKARLIQASFLLVVIFASSASCRKYEKDLNDFMDNMFKRIVADHGNKLDPVELPATDIIISKTVMLVTATGTIKLTSGLLSGMRTLRRITNYNLSAETDNVATFTGESAVSGLLAKYKSSFSMMLFNIYPTLNVAIDMIRLKSDVVVDFKQKIITLQKTKLYMDGFKVTVHDLGPLNWIADLVVSSCEDMLRPQFEKTILQSFARALSKVLRNITFPF